MNKKVRCINAKDSNGKLVEGEIYKVIDEYGRFYDLEGVDMSDWYKSRFEDVVEPKQEVKPEQKYPIIERFGTYKVVFNPPYTIVEAYIFGEPYFKGKAKCNPKDTFDKWKGFKLAMSRFEEI